MYIFKVYQILTLAKNSIFSSEGMDKKYRSECVKTRHFKWGRGLSPFKPLSCGEWYPLLTPNPLPSPNLIDPPCVPHNSGRIYATGDRSTRLWTNTCPESLRSRAQPGVEPATSWSLASPTPKPLRYYATLHRKKTVRTFTTLDFKTKQVSVNMRAQFHWKF